MLWNVCYTRKNVQLVTNLQQTCSNVVSTICHQDVFALLVPSLLTSCQGVLTVCYKILSVLVKCTLVNMMLVMLLWVYIHIGQAWKICLSTVGIEPTTFGILAQCAANWATRSGRFVGRIFFKLARYGYTLRVTSQASVCYKVFDSIDLLQVVPTSC